jgi:hypothetical protein
MSASWGEAATKARDQVGSSRPLAAVVTSSEYRATVSARQMKVTGRENMRRLTIAGLLAALTLGTFVLVGSVLVASAQPAPLRPSYWPALNGAPYLTEWFSDLPWTQKLGTYRGNEIDEAYMLPYGALPPQNQTYCNNQNPKLSQARCMIETGINSIVGIQRSDTLYKSDNPLILAATRCQPNFNPATPCAKTLKYCLDSSVPCTEVKLAVSMFWTRSDDAAQKTLTLDPRPIGREPQGCAGGAHEKRQAEPEQRRRPLLSRPKKDEQPADQRYEHRRV